MLERTVVAIMGEFGRTPRINNGGGRDHWIFCYAVLLVVVGLNGGYVHGASDRIGARPSLNPVVHGVVVEATTWRRRSVLTRAASGTSLLNLTNDRRRRPGC
jgi:hypothetical protein